jgi:hypothetical protein
MPAGHVMRIAGVPPIAPMSGTGSCCLAGCSCTVAPCSTTSTGFMATTIYMYLDRDLIIRALNNQTGFYQTVTKHAFGAVPNFVGLPLVYPGDVAFAIGPCEWRGDVGATVAQGFRIFYYFPFSGSGQSTVNCQWVLSWGVRIGGSTIDQLVLNWCLPGFDPCITDQEITLVPFDDGSFPVGPVDPNGIDAGWIQLPSVVRLENCGCVAY